MPVRKKELFIMKKVLTNSTITSIFLFLSLNFTAVAEEENHQEIVLSQTQLAQANIQVAAIYKQVMSSQFYAPGEIKANGYTSYYVSPRVESVVLKRHAILGERVKKGSPLVTLFSEDVAQAQATYRVAYADWQRVKNLTSETVSEKQKLTVQTDYVTAMSRLKAYGLTDEAIVLLRKNTNALLGEYTLTAIRDGAVLSDDFHQGQRINAGITIMVLTDESQLWVEAQLPPAEELHLPTGSLAQISLAGKHYQAKVIQSAHTIDAKTRTRIVRLLVENPQDKLHAGMFVDVTFANELPEPTMAVPEGALIRGADGDWQVFVEHEAGEFQALEVELGQVLVMRSSDGEQVNYQEIFGLTEGNKVVISGVFFVASQAAKSGFEAHNH
jgi:cobalt-zinc-cadmium efflux system membrane fusion protein